MNLLTKDFRINKWTIAFAAIIWFLLAVTAVVLKIRLGPDKIGNYLVFENVFWNMVHQKNLYFVDPSSNLGSYLYGPLFYNCYRAFCFFFNKYRRFFMGRCQCRFFVFGYPQIAG